MRECVYCNRKFKNLQAVRAHLRFCPLNPRNIKKKKATELLASYQDALKLMNEKQGKEYMALIYARLEKLVNLYEKVQDAQETAKRYRYRYIERILSILSLLCQEALNRTDDPVMKVYYLQVLDDISAMTENINKRRSK